MLNRKSDFIKIDDFQVFPVFLSTLVTFEKKYDDFSFDFYKISLSCTVKAN